jgi:hypothetical protein
MSWPEQPPLHTQPDKRAVNRSTPLRWLWVRCIAGAGLGFGWWQVCHALHWPGAVEVPGFTILYVTASIVIDRLRRRSVRRSGMPARVKNH